jgi:hypothetical protein
MSAHRSLLRCTMEPLQTCIHSTGRGYHVPYFSSLPQWDVLDGNQTVVSAFDVDFTPVRNVDPVFPVSAEVLDEDVFADRLIESVQVSSCALNGDEFDEVDVELFGPERVARVQAVASSDKTGMVTKEVLARRWGIGLETAQRTLTVTTQRGVRTFVHPTDRRFGTNKPHLVFPTMRDKKLYTDTMFAKVRSIRDNNVAQVWTDDNNNNEFNLLLQS